MTLLGIAVIVLALAGTSPATSNMTPLFALIARTCGAALVWILASWNHTNSLLDPSIPEEVGGAAVTDPSAQLEAGYTFALIDLRPGIGMWTAGFAAVAGLAVAVIGLVSTRTASGRALTG